MTEIGQMDLPKYVGKEVVFEVDGVRKVVKITSFDGGEIKGEGLIRCLYQFKIDKDFPKVKYFANE